MGRYLVQQPNGLYCLMSTVTDTVCKWNLPESYVGEYARKKTELGWWLIDADDREVLNSDASDLASFEDCVKLETMSLMASISRRTFQEDIYDRILAGAINGVDVSQIAEFFDDIEAPAGSYAKLVADISKARHES